MRILFVCLGNSCRSQMAEGFARAYGQGVWEVESAGLMPATIIAPPTKTVMAEKDISLDEQFPKPLAWVDLDSFDLVVNLTEYELPPEVTVPVRSWPVRDPIGHSDKVHRQVRDDIESRILALLAELRKSGTACMFPPTSPRD